MVRDPVTLTQLLEALCGGIDVLEQRGDMNCQIHAITDDSRAVTGGSLFVAVKGERVDGHEFVDQAIKAGAVAVVAQAPVALGSLPFVRVNDSRKALGHSRQPISWESLRSSQDDWSDGYEWEDDDDLSLQSVARRDRSASRVDRHGGVSDWAGDASCFSHDTRCTRTSSDSWRRWSRADSPLS